MPLSAISLAAAGMATPALLVDAGAAAAAAGAAAATCSGSGCRRSGAGHSGGVDLGDHLVGRHGGAVALHDLDQHASRGRRAFEHHLVGFDVDQDFIDCDRITDLFLPLQQCGFGHRFGELRNFDFYDCHFLLSCCVFELPARGRHRAPPSLATKTNYLVSKKPLSLLKAASTRAFCCSWCKWA
jgi:hypothetical protein